MKVEIAPWYRPNQPAQLRLHQSKARFKVATAGVRGGKSISLTVEFARNIYLDLKSGKSRRVAGTGKRRQPALLYWIVSPTAGLTKVPVRYLLDSVPHSLIERVYESENSIWLKPDILVEFKTAERPDLLVGSGVDGMLLDEACRIKETTWASSLRGRLTDTGGWALFATSPLGRQNWVYRELVEKAGHTATWRDGRLVEAATSGDPQIESISWPTAANPRIDREEIEQAKRQLPKRYFERDYLASWDSFVGTVYDAFTVPTHVTTEAALRLEYGINGRPLRSLFRRVIAGIDHGWNAPGCILVVGDTGRELIVLEEDYATNRTVFDSRNEASTWIGAAKRLRAKWGVELFVADPAEPRTIFDYQRCGLPVVGANNELLFGIRKVSEQMQPVDGKPRLRVMSSCVNLIREIQAYQWATSRSGDLTEIPADRQSDHALDPLRYATVELREFDAPANTGWPSQRQRSVAGPIS